MGRLEQRDIRYRGYSTLPDDYQVADGAIAFATNAVYEDGGLKVLQEAKPLELLVAAGAQIYIHHTVNYYHYIIVYSFKDEGGSNYVRLYVVDKKMMEDWLDKEGNEWVDAIYHIGSKDDLLANMTEGVVDFLYRCEGAFVSLVAVANTLVVSTEEEMYYFLCKPGGVDEEQTALTESCEHEYIFLGNKVPSVEVEFGLGLTVLSKSYEDTGIEKTASSNAGNDHISSDTGWTQLAYLSCTAHSEKETFPFPDTITLTTGKVYRLELTDFLASTPYINVYGTKEGDSEASLIKELMFNNKYPTFKTDGTYTDIYLTLPLRPSQSGYPRGVSLWLEEAVDSSYGGHYYVAYTEENYEAVQGCVNKFVVDYGTNKNRFIHPFFVRYAVRMYDASVCELSVPILMMPNSGYVPFVHSNTLEDDDTLNLYSFVADLRYRLLEGLSVAWQDMIQGVEIYVSQPVYPYDQGESYDDTELRFSYKDYITTSGSERDDMSNLSFGYGTLDDASGIVIDGGYSAQRLFDVLKEQYAFGDSSQSAYWRLTQIAPKTDDEIDEEIKKVSSFYLIKKLNFDDLRKESDFMDIVLEKGVLSGLAGRETLDEDVIGYAGFVGSGLYSYNQRLHTFGGELIYRDVVKVPFHSQYLDTSAEFDGEYYVTEHKWYETWVYIRTNDGTKVVHTEYDGSVQYYGGRVWFFYPNNRAYKVVVGVNDIDSQERYYELPLSEHEFLNGAYYYLHTERGFNDEVLMEYIIDEPPTKYDENIASTSIYVSEVNNPFVFRNSSAVTVGSGQMLALSSAAQAMSQGQFGQYPLYAFTDEGVWALSVQTDGTYGTSQPIARDVCTNVDSITQLDSSVLFVTDRGIMEIAGSTVACISEGIDGEWGEFNPLVLPYFAELYLKYVEGVVEGDEDYEAKKVAFEAMVNTWSEERFFNFIKTCRMVYDYVHQRILVYNGERSIGYNYSLESKEWSLMFSELRYSVNSYPEALALEKVDDAVYGLPSDEEHWGLVNVSEYVDEGEGEEDVSTELFVTRPFKLDAPDVFKMVDSVVQRGYFQQSAKENHVVGSVLYGSVDLFNWEIVGQSATVEVVKGSGQYTPGHIIDRMQGSPYKYFRVAVLCRLRRRETICGCSMLYELKDNNMLR